MMSPKARLVVAAGLFLAWMGWLVYLVAQTRHPVVLSRPQFLVADLYVTARLRADGDKPAARVTIEETLWARDAGDKLPAGTEVTIPALAESWQKEDAVKPKYGPDQGWQGERVYLLPLIKKKGDYDVASIPLSPGFAKDEAHRLQIYPANDEALSQARDIIAKK
jgi:hypothetical protein